MFNQTFNKQTRVKSVNYSNILYSSFVLSTIISLSGVVANNTSLTATGISGSFASATLASIDKNKKKSGQPEKTDFIVHEIQNYVESKQAEIKSLIDNFDLQHSQFQQNSQAWQSFYQQQLEQLKQNVTELQEQNFPSTPDEQKLAELYQQKLSQLEADFYNKYHQLQKRIQSTGGKLNHRVTNLEAKVKKEHSNISSQPSKKKSVKQKLPEHKPQAESIKSVGNSQASDRCSNNNLVSNPSKHDAHLGDRESYSKPDNCQQEASEQIYVELTELEQEMYALMGLSPSILLDREISDSQSVLIHVKQPQKTCFKTEAFKQA